MMTAFRFLWAAGLLLASGVASAQQPRVAVPKTISAHRYISDAQWQHAPVVESDVHPEAIVGEPYPAPIEMEEVTVECKCGKKKCHGVCTDPGHPKKPKIKKPGDRDRGDCPPKRYCIADCKRAGNPHCVAWWAKCSVSDKYSSWFVGGGSPFRLGRCRKPTEGTWGLDYDGLFGHGNVWLNYTRGRKQGGEGAYQTDGEPEFVKKAHNILGLGH